MFLRKFNVLRIFFQFIVTNQQITITTTSNKLKTGSNSPTKIFVLTRTKFSKNSHPKATASTVASRVLNKPNKTPANKCQINHSSINSSVINSNVN